MDDDMRNDFLIDDAELDLDDEVDAPTAVRRRGRGNDARRTAAYRPARMRRTPNWSRIATAAFVVVVGLAVLYVAVSSWRGHARKVAFEQYFDDVRDVVNQSNTQGKELDSMLTQNSGVDRAQLVSQLEKLERRSAALQRDAAKVEAPEQLVSAHKWLVVTMEYRQHGFEQLRRGMTSALSTRDQSGAATALSGAMARLLASDVLYEDSYASRARAALRSSDVSGITVPDSVTVAQLDAVAPKGMELILDRLRSSRVTTTKGGKTKPVKDGKVHGGQLDQVTITPSGEVLTAGSVTEITGSDELAFEVTFTNQGEVQETKIPVVITLSSDANPTVELSGEIEVVDPGQTGSVTIPVDEVPAFGTTFDMKVMVGPVPGERTVDNNGASYQVTFRL